MPIDRSRRSRTTRASPTRRTSHVHSRARSASRPRAIARCGRLALSAVLDADDLGHERRALLALDLHRRLGRYAKSVAVHRLDVLELVGPQSDARAGRHGVSEAHLVAAVVQAALAGRDLHQRLGHARHERQREITVGDRLASGHLLLRTLDIHVDPLMIAGGGGELVDDRLVHRHPVGRAGLPPDVLRQLGWFVYRQRHTGSRWYMPCTSGPWKRATWFVGASGSE